MYPIMAYVFTPGEEVSFFFTFRRRNCVKHSSSINAQCDECPARSGRRCTIMRRMNSTVL